MTISDLLSDSKNPNRGSEAGDRALDASITQLGFGRGIVADKDGVLIAGNGTQQASIRAGLTKIKVVETDGDTVIVNKRTDLDFDSEDAAVRARTRALSLADNQVPRIRQNIDMVVVQEHLVTCNIVPATCGYTQSDVIPATAQASETAASSPETPAGPAPEVPRIRQVVVNCQNEDEQQQVYEMLANSELLAALDLKPELRSL